MPALHYALKVVQPALPMCVHVPRPTRMPVATCALTRHLLPEHTLDVQSEAAPHAMVSAHLPQVGPPQSTSVSPPFLALSEQVGACTRKDGKVASLQGWWRGRLRRVISALQLAQQAEAEADIHRGRHVSKTTENNRANQWKCGRQAGWHECTHARTHAHMHAHACPHSRTQTGRQASTMHYALKVT